MSQFYFSLLLVVFSFAASAQTISKIGNSGQVLIEFDSFNEHQAQPGSEYFAMSEEGKKVAIIQLKKVKGNQAVGIITKGKALVGQQLVLRGAETEGSNSSTAFHRKPGFPVAVLVGYGASSMSLTGQYSSTGATVDRSGTLNMTGTSFNLKAFGEINLVDRFFARGTGGLEIFNTKGTGKDSSSGLAICDSGASSDCKANFNYLAMEGSIHWAFMQSKSLRGHIGGGYSYLVTLSKDVNIPNLKASAATNQMMLAKLGFDFMTKQSFFPVIIEYGYIPGDNVKASALYLRGGYGFYF